MEPDNTEIQHIIQRIQEMSLPQLKLIIEHTEHEIELALKEAEYNRRD